MTRNVLNVFAMTALIALGAVVSPVRADTAPATRPGAHREVVKQELQAVKADVEALKAAHQNKDKVAARAALEKLRTDWQALPPAARKRVLANHPQLAKLLERLRERHRNT